MDFDLFAASEITGPLGQYRPDFRLGRRIPRVGTCNATDEITGSDITNLLSCRLPENPITPPFALGALSQLRAPIDTAGAYEQYRATCGPCAFAAMLGRDVGDVISWFPDFPRKDFTNLPAMSRALRTAGIQWCRTRELPPTGLALLSGRQRYYSRHWIAIEGAFVYEVLLEMWLPLFVWRRDFLPVLAAEFRSKPAEWQVEAAFHVTAVSLGFSLEITRPGTRNHQKK